MERTKFFWLSRRYHVIDNPISEAKLDQVIEALRLAPGDSVVDIASGKAEMICRIAAKYGARCTGVEWSAYHCEEATTKVRERGLDDLVSIKQMPGEDFRAEDASFMASMCIGADWIFGGAAKALEALTRWTRPGGDVVLGAPFWIAKPPATYLAAAGLSEETFTSHRANVALGENLGLKLIYAAASSTDDWDRYVGLTWRAAYDYVDEYASDPDNTEIIERTEQDKTAYFSGGRDCLGWAIYVFRKPR
jgi:SAM-dependent methyltransferase